MIPMDPSNSPEFLLLFQKPAEILLQSAGRYTLNNSHTGVLDNPSPALSVSVSTDAEVFEKIKLQVVFLLFIVPNKKNNRTADNFHRVLITTYY